VNEDDVRREWTAIAAATAVLVPAFWAAPIAAIAAAPFVFTVLALLSAHGNLPRAVLRAMGLSLLVGSCVTVLLLNAASGVVAGVGAGGLVALRNHIGGWRFRAIGVAVATAYTFVLVLVLGTIAVAFAPLFPLAALGLADHVAVRRLARSSR
jgi:hypothetical protein